MDHAARPKTKAAREARFDEELAKQKSDGGGRRIVGREGYSSVQ
jgi:hypothetical protein